ncbi:MAG: hypothetical protein NTY19_22530 [Planctomycetota bacterium]|nr:hypothetical protein [Planctomycetota bacterium]
MSISAPRAGKLQPHQRVSQSDGCVRVGRVTIRAELLGQVRRVGEGSATREDFHHGIAFTGALSPLAPQGAWGERALVGWLAPREPPPLAANWSVYDRPVRERRSRDGPVLQLLAARWACSYIVPDFLVEMTSGQKRLVEVKSSDRLAKPLAQRKLSVAR